MAYSDLASCIVALSRLGSARESESTPTAVTEQCVGSFGVNLVMQHPLAGDECHSQVSMIPALPAVESHQPSDFDSEGEILEILIIRILN